MPLLIYRVSVFVRWWRGDFPIYDTRHDGLDWMAGMGEDDVAEFSAALRGEGALRSFLEPLLDQLEDVSVDGILESLASLLPDVDRAARSDEFGEDMPASFHEGLRLGIDGWAPPMDIGSRRRSPAPRPTSNTAGHLSIGLGAIDRMLDELMTASGRS